MKASQRIQLRMSQRRQRMGELLALDDLDAEQRNELDTATAGLQADEVELRAAIAVEAAEADATAAEHGDGKPDPVVELRSRCSLAAFLSSAMSGRSLSGAEREYADEIGLGTGYVPLTMFDVETRAETRAVSDAPTTVGVNLDPIRPSIFARAVSPRLGIDMPRVASGTYATGTITTDLTAAAKSKGDAAGATAAAITVQTTTPHRVSARLSIAIEDVASIGTDNFEAALRQNLSLALSAQLDQYTLNGDGTDPNPQGLLGRLTDPTDPTDTIGWLGFVKAVSGGIDGGPWAEDLTHVRLLVNAATMRLAEETFREPAAVGSPTNTYSDTPGAMSAAAYLRQHAGGFFASSRMPAAASGIAPAIRYRPGTMGLDGVDAVRTAVCPIWSEVGIDDIYTDSAKGQRHVTFHVLTGDVILVQPDAYERVDLKLA